MCLLNNRPCVAQIAVQPAHSSLLPNILGQNEQVCSQYIGRYVASRQKHLLYMHAALLCVGIILCRAPHIHASVLWECQQCDEVLLCISGMRCYALATGDDLYRRSSRS